MDKVTSPSSEGGDEDRVRSDRGSNAGTPRWVKVIAIVALVLAIVVIVVLLASGGSHGPGRHAGEATLAAVGHPA
jgi:hypothetical protein